MLRLIVATFIAASALFISQPGMAYEMGSLSCTVAVTEPMWDDCAGAYTLDNGENDVTNGDELDIVSQILSEGGFGGDGWEFGAKYDGAYEGDSSLFTVTGIDSTSGVVDFGESPLIDDLVNLYDIAISFKAADSFSIYYWEAPLLSSTISWTTSGVAMGNEFPKDLSHVSVYLRGTTSIPEPGTLALFALGLIGFVMSRREAR